MSFHLLLGPTRATTQRLDRVDARHGEVESPPDGPTGVDGDALGPDPDEVEPELVLHLGDPLQLHALGSDDEDAADSTTGKQLGRDRARGRGLAQARPRSRWRAEPAQPQGALQDRGLVGKEIDPGACSDRMTGCLPRQGPAGPAPSQPAREAPHWRCFEVN